MPGKHIETQAEWESAMAQKVFAAIRGELYLALPYMNAALCALTPAEQDSLTAFCHRRRPALLCARLAAGAVPQKTMPICPAPTCTACSIACSGICGCGAAGTRLCGALPATLRWSTRWTAWACRHWPGRWAGCAARLTASWPASAGCWARGPSTGRCAVMPRRNLPACGRNFSATATACGPKTRMPPPHRCRAAAGSSWVARRSFRCSRPAAGRPPRTAPPPLAAQVQAGQSRRQVPGLFAQICRLAGGTPPGPGRV